MESEKGGRESPVGKSNYYSLARIKIVVPRTKRRAIRR
jgi:hypothetical protein